MKTIYLLRHGETEYNRLGIIQGKTIDASLNEKGQTQAEAFFQQYKHLPFEVVLTSSLKRTHQTVHHFIQNGLPWQQMPEIDEYSWGIYEGQPNKEEIGLKNEQLIEAWTLGRLHEGPPEGETGYDLVHRIEKFITHIKTRPESLLLVCSHGRAMRCLVCLMKGLPPSEMHQFSYANTGLSISHFDGENFLFQTENNLDHVNR